MNLLEQTDEIFFKHSDLDVCRTQNLIRNALSNCDDGELFFEMRHSEVLTFDDGRLKTSSYDQSSGFGLRAVAGDSHGYAHSGELSEGAISRASNSVSAVTKATLEEGHRTERWPNRPLYSDQNLLKSRLLKN